MDLLIFLANTSQTLEGPIEAIAGKFGVTWPLLMAQILNFCIVAILIYQFALKPILSTIDERQRKIAEGLQYAQEMKDKLMHTDHECQEKIRLAAIEAKSITADAKKSAQHYLQEQLALANTQAEEVIKKGEASIAIEKNLMLQALQKEVVHLVANTTAKVLEKNLSDTERKHFTQAATHELSHS